MFLYPLIDLQNMACAPWRLCAQAALVALRHPLCPLARTEYGQSMVAATALFEHSVHGISKKPDFGIKQVSFRGGVIEIDEDCIDATPFCRLLHFKRKTSDAAIAEHIVNDPKLLIVTPMSGHFATLMRGTVEAMLPSHDVYITDWIDAKMVPLSYGYFDLEDQIDYLMTVIERLGAGVNILAISQASVSALCAVALLAAREEGALAPRTLTLIGGPINAQNQTVALTEAAAKTSLSALRAAQIQMVPAYYPGALRRVYPGVMQLLDRMSMSLGRHITEQLKYFQYLVRGDDDAAEIHARFYDEFLAVADVPEEFYIQYVERAYQRHDLANGSFVFRSQRVDLTAIRDTALFTVEGELDDLSPAGHTRAALDLCPNIPPEKKAAHLEIGVGHYGVFSGRKWRNNIQPLIHKFIREHC